jgi:hypothetical protein
MDVEQLLKALDNDENEHLINMTSEKLNNMKKELKNCRIEYLQHIIY